MELQFDITESFKADLDRLPAEQKARVENQITLVSGSLLNGRTAFKENSSIPYIFSLKEGFDSSLYLIKGDQDTRIVAAVDEDPIYDQIQLTLFRVVDKNEADQVYKQVGEKIYNDLRIL